MPKPSIYFTYRELFDRVPTQDELVSIVKGLNPFNTVLLTSRLNTIFRHALWSNNPQDAHALDRFQYWIAASFFDLEIKKRIERRFGNQNPTLRPVCYPLQLLNIMRLALRVGEGDENSRPDTSQVHTFQLGAAFLMVSDLFLTAEEQQSIYAGTADERRKRLMLQSLATIEISNPTDPSNLIFRSYGMYRVALRDPQLLSRIRNECGGLDIEQDFEHSFGIPLIGWLSLVFAVQLLFLNFTQADFINKAETFLINRKTILPNSNLSQSQIDGFFDGLSTSFDDLRIEMRKERPVDDRLDVVPFKSRPLFITSPDTYACLDFELLTEKMHTGPYFSLANKLPSEQRWKVFNAWGLLFEAYVIWLLQGLVQSSATFFSDTHWSGDDTRAFDALFVDGAMVVAMEFKGGFLPQSARYSNELNIFMGALEERVGDGCHQLASGIAALFPERDAARKLRDVAIPSSTRIILPVLVVQDLILRAPFINYVLNQRFQSERTQFPTEKNVEVMPLTVVHITELEDLVRKAEASDFDVLQLFRRRSQIDKEMLSDLSDFNSLIPPSTERDRPTRFQEILSKSTDELAAVLFHEP